MKNLKLHVCSGAIAAALVSLSITQATAQTPGIFPLLPPQASTVPSNGDVNPYGIAYVPNNVPASNILKPGDILVSNFNNQNNLQGTGTTILRIDKAGNTSTYYTSSKPGLTAAIGVLSDGVVLIGNLPTADGTPATVQPGSLTLVYNGSSFGTIGTSASVNGPWGMAVHDVGNGVTGTAKVFISNILSGEITRFDITYNAGGVNANQVIVASGFSHRTDPAALVLGPTGLAYDSVHDILYLASSAANAIYEIKNAGATQSTVGAMLLISDLTHLHGPLDIAILPDGDLVIAQSDGTNVDPNQPSELVEYTAAGQFVGQMSLDPNNGGAFGVAVNNLGWGTYRLAAVDDNTNTLKIWTSVIP
jgi:hypothetical protein